MFTETALLQEILAHPHDEDPWLVFADWLDDRGDPRAELVRLRHELTRSIKVKGRTAKEARMQQLLGAGVEPITPTMTNTVGMKLALILPGEFLMGSPAIEEDRDDDEDQVDVTLTRGFYLGETAVTQAQWTAVMGTQPWSGESYVKEGPSHTATYISWDDAAEYCTKFTKQEQGTGRLAKDWRYALPTEAQWEYACRAGTTTAFYFGDDSALLDDYDWFGDNAFDIGEKYAHEVRLKKPNAWGLYDMHGNVVEWCRDGYQPDLPGGIDPASVTGSFRVYRGGSCGGAAWFCRSARRSRHLPSNRDFYLGFRLAAVPVGGAD